MLVIECVDFGVCFVCDVWLEFLVCVCVFVCCLRECVLCVCVCLCVVYGSVYCVCVSNVCVVCFL